jgi:phosphopantothenoylcysteine decarboxylase/phosphopantothenate--cysteine ligase
MAIKGKHILIGVSAGIAAYKIPFLVRHLRKAGAEVKIVMTPTSTDFVTPLTLSTVSQNPVFVEAFDSKTGEWNSHVELALWADAMLIAPATANTMAKMVSGITDNLLMATYLSSRTQVFVAPTMDLDMYKHPSTQRNIQQLQDWGHIILEPNTGELASGLEGTGRMQEPEELFDALESFFKKKSKNLTPLKVLISAGPTYEKIDPVRFIGNNSSGKMGIELAKAFAQHGAKVCLVSGPGVEKLHGEGIIQKPVVSAQQMFETCTSEFDNADITIMAAAIADFTPKNPAKQKIKKGNKAPSIELIATEDVLFNLGLRKQDHQLLVGFALETQNEVENALKKLRKKNLDFIVLNSLQDKGAGFGGDTNKIMIIDRNEKKQSFDLKSKAEVAQDIFNHCILRYNELIEA